MTLDIGEDRILLETRSNVYLLDIFLPFNIVQEEVGAQFNKKTKVTLFANIVYVISVQLLKNRNTVASSLTQNHFFCRFLR